MCALKAHPWDTVAWCPISSKVPTLPQPWNLGLTGRRHFRAWTAVSTLVTHFLLKLENFSCHQPGTGTPGKMKLSISQNLKLLFAAQMWGCKPSARCQPSLGASWQGRRWRAVCGHFAEAGGTEWGSLCVRQATSLQAGLS